MTLKRKNFFWKNILIFFFIVSYLLIGTNNFYIVDAQNNQEDKCGKILETFDKNINELEKSYVKCGGGAIKDFYTPRQIDKFGIIGLEGEWARLDSFASVLYSDPSITAFIVIYGGKTTKYGELKERPKPLVHYLINNRKIEPNRIKIIEGGFREKFEFELWISHSEKMFPPLSPTIEPEKVIFMRKDETVAGRFLIVFHNDGNE